MDSGVVGIMYIPPLFFLSTAYEGTEKADMYEIVQWTLGDGWLTTWRFMRVE